MSFRGFIFLLLGTLAINAMADNPNVLRFDDRALPDSQAPFARDGQPLRPKKNDFRVRDVSPLSSEAGERWVLLTLENTGGGTRLLSDDYLVAEFANGERREAVNLEGKLDAGEQVRQTIFFGYHRFPIVRVLDGGDQ
ncbi:MAG: hypothetical protein FH757_10260 [Alcanivorax sp.]|nr:hypothetical protein [Alcanivorax sp.]